MFGPPPQSAYGQQPPSFGHAPAPVPSPPFAPVPSPPSAPAPVRLPQKTLWAKLLGDTDIFELLTAVQLGLAALGGGWAAYQSSQWGGTAIEDFGKASTLATKGSTAFNTSVALITRDAQVEIQAKQLTLDAITAEEKNEKVKNALLARYLYGRQLSALGYEALGLPAGYHDESKFKEMPDDALVKAMKVEFPQEYYTAMTKSGNDKFKESESVFEEGDTASALSTKFGQVAMFFTTALFFTGTGLVVKHRPKWAFLALGFLTLVVGTIKLFLLKWYSA